MKKLRIVVIVQARMGATRLPEKPLKQIMHRPLLSYQLERLRRAQTVAEVVVATTTAAADQAIVDLCLAEGVSVYRGSEQDVLDRYYQAAKLFQADVIVRVTGDCPLIDPAVLDRLVSDYIEHFPAYDYISNAIVRTYPRGLDVEVFSFKSLEIAASQARRPEEREHVTPYFYEHPELFALKNIANATDASDQRWTVDTAEDFLLIGHIITALYPENPGFGMQDILELLGRHPEWEALNRHIKQKPLR